MAGKERPEQTRREAPLLAPLPRVLAAACAVALLYMIIGLAVFGLVRHPVLASAAGALVGWRCWAFLADAPRALSSAPPGARTPLRWAATILAAVIGGGGLAGFVVLLS